MRAEEVVGERDTARVALTEAEKYAHERDAARAALTDEERRAWKLALAAERDGAARAHERARDDATAAARARDDATAVALNSQKETSLLAESSTFAFRW